MIRDADEFIERNIVIGLIASTEFLKRVRPHWDSSLLESLELATVADWCMVHYRKYNQAPDKNIESIYMDHLHANRLNKADAQYIEEMLAGLSDDYGGDGVQVGPLWDRTVAYLQAQHWQRHQADVQDLIDRGQVGEAVTLAQSYTPLDVGGPATAEDAWPERGPLPAALPLVPALPAGLLPTALRPWLQDVASRACIPLEFVAAPALVALGAVVGRRVGIRPGRNDDYTVVPNLWGGIVGRPGAMKSYAVQEALRPVHMLARTAREVHTAAKQLADVRREVIQAEIDSVKADMRKAFGKKDVVERDTLEGRLKGLKADLAEAVPTERRYLTQDATTEKLGELLRDNPHGMLLYRDELAGWLRTMDRPGHEGDREFYLESWDGTGGYTVDRIGRGTLHISALCLSLVGGIQPGKLQRYITEATDGGFGSDGLLQRLQVLVWPDSLGEWRQADNPPDGGARARAYQVFQRLDTCNPIIMLDATEVPDGGIPYLRFDLDAQAYYDEWRQALETRLRGDELAETPAYESHLAKYRSLMPSLALLFHVVRAADRDEPGPVSLRAAQTAAKWCEFLEAHAKKVYAAEVAPELGAAHALAERIEAGQVKDGQTLRDLYLRGWRGLGTAERMSAAMEVLERVAWVRVETQEAGTLGGRPSQILRLHPALRSGLP